MVPGRAVFHSFLQRPTGRPLMPILFHLPGTWRGLSHFELTSADMERAGPIHLSRRPEEW